MGLRAQFRASVSQVEVYASVTDTDGRPLRDLTVADFTVLDDGEPQRLTVFQAGDVPASVALAIDRSVSMRGARLAVARTAGRVFVRALDPDDRVMVIGIGSQVEVLAAMAEDRSGAERAIAALDAFGTTSLHDAAIEALDLLESEGGRRAIVLLSDGEDRYSRATAADVLARARRSDVMIYPVALGPRRPALFAELAAASGGRWYHLREMRHLAPTLAGIAEDLGAQYLLGYAPSRPWGTEPEWRSIEVRVARDGVRVRARGGYTTR
ncbi:MAG: VWA domain-containing protein [Acidobacteriota bacterium]